MRTLVPTLSLGRAWLAVVAGLGLLNPNAMADTNAAAVTRRWVQTAGIAPAFQAPATLAEWELERINLRKELWQLLGRLPERPPVPSVNVLSREDRGDYVLEKISFDNLAGSDVPGYLLLPKGSVKPGPAVLYCHWHGGQYEIGKEELFRTNAVPEAPGPALVKRGFVVLAIDAPCFGERNGLVPGGTAGRNGVGELTASKFNLWVGRTLWGMILRDDLMALDYLVTRPEVDARRVGVTGISMGATRTWWLMALDERLKAGSATACLTRYADLIQTQGLAYHGIYYYVPDMLTRFDTEAVVSLIAPRPILFQTGDSDGGSPVDGIRTIEGVARKVYGLYGREAAFDSRVYAGLGHVYTPEMWQRTLAWLEQHL